LRRSLAALCLLLPLLGCGLFVSKETRAMRRTPDYKAGYGDGCASAPGQDADMRDETPLRRDDDMYDKNKAYRAGWGAGYNGCRAYTPQNMGQTPDRGPIPDVNPGGGTIP
jgi:hypothetical protein